MKRIPKPLLAFLTATFLTGWSVPRVSADILYIQPYNGVSPGTASQIFPDYPTNPTGPYDIQAYDDFVVPKGATWNVTKVTLFGSDQGNPAVNQDVQLQINSSIVYHSPIASGVEDGSGNLVFTQPFTLTGGTYWISGWVVRPETLPVNNPGGQWFWDETQPIIGSEYYLWNPGGGWGYGTSLVPGSATGNPAADLAFEIDGSAIPEPTGWVLLATGAACVFVVRRAKRNQL